MLTIRDEPDCGNAPRKQTLRELVVALATGDSEYIDSLLADDIEWIVIGDCTLNGRVAVRDWVAGLRGVDELTFGSLLTHGKGASVDGTLQLTDGTWLAFSHVLQFAGVAKSAQVRSVASYIIVVQRGS